MSLHKVVMIRHGESEWTNRNLFCGWYDSLLSEQGHKEAIEAARLLMEIDNMKFDIVFTSLLSRAMRSVEVILDEINQKCIQVEKAWQLNERHYGHLTGMNKEKAVEQYGHKQVQLWRRSFDILPPPMSEDHFCYNEIRDYFRKFGAHIHVPRVESLKTTMERVIPYWRESIVPSILSDKNVLIVSHGTVLRSLIKHIEGISDSQIMNINVPTAIPFIYEFDSELNPQKSKTFLGDQDKIDKAIKKTAAISRS
ncbi:hypothetical protein LSTR_LSTR002987 [Laodelphax striatellus]|uniref:phosphoglycerate mutase (2,3-diphosphoglycerate-dependent) n=1 Tax=Laodelphax striatellus TaxID=195883 RepID=A0A482WT96_LAOST|nr:hypothetical protein LSTR_LSTR002987 [Laodelphax striatellus]